MKPTDEGGAPVPPSEHQQENTQNRAPLETAAPAAAPPAAADVVRAADGVQPDDAERDVVRASDDAAAAPAAAAAVAPESAPEVAAPPDSGEKDQHVDWLLDVEHMLNLKRSGEKSFLTAPMSMHGVEFVLLVFPGGRAPNEFGVFLKRSDRAIQYNWSVYAAFRFTVVNHADASKSKDMTEEGPKLWDADHNDWGFWHLGVPADQLFNESEGFIVDGRITVRTRLLKIEKRSMMLGFNSRKETGLAGLENQGATCYLNSLLQSLYHLPAFRRAVYGMSVKPEDTPTKSVPLALQRLFYHLEKSDVAQTKELTKSFGWNSYEAFTQHDVQEMLRVLTDKLEEKMKEQGMAGLIQNLFRGDSISYIRCINVNCVSERQEHFYDLALNVSGCANLYESLDKFVEVETLDGVNQYRSDQFGLQDAHRGIRLHRLPPVLHIQLKRFEYDPYRDQTAKVNTRHEFPAVLDLNRYIAADQPRPPSGFVYDLVGVLVHSGDVGGGHYYAYIRPSITSPDWFRFDDDKISKATAEEAMEGNYGGPAVSLFGGYRDSTALRRNSAYMLVYVMKHESERIMKPLSESELPQHVAAMVERERDEAAKRAEEASQAHLYMQISVATLNDFASVPDGTDLVKNKLPLVIKIERLKPFMHLKLQIAQKLNVAPESFVLVKLHTDNDAQIRFNDVIPASQYSKTCENVLSFLGGALFNYGIVVVMLKDLHVQLSLKHEATAIAQAVAAAAASGDSSSGGSGGSGGGGSGEGVVEMQRDEQTGEFIEAPALYRHFLPNAALIVVKRFQANAGTGELIARGFALVDKRTTLNEQLPCAALAAGLPLPTGESAAPIVAGVPSPLWVFEEKNWKRTLTGYINNAKDKRHENVEVATGAIWILQVPPPAGAMNELLKVDQMPATPTDDDGFKHLLKLVRSPSVYQYIKFLRSKILVKLSPFSPDGVDVLPPIEIAVNDEWPIDAVTGLLPAKYDEACPVWLHDSRIALEAAEKAAAAADANDANVNATLREARVRVAAATVRAAQGALRPSHVRLHEVVNGKPVALPLAPESKSIKEALTYNGNHVLMYERMPMNRAELLECFDARVFVASMRGAAPTEVHFFVHKQKTIGDLCKLAVAERQKVDKTDAPASPRRATTPSLNVPTPGTRPTSPGAAADDDHHDHHDELFDDDDTRVSDTVQCWKTSSSRPMEQYDMSQPLDSKEVPLASKFGSELLVIPLSVRDAALLSIPPEIDAPPLKPTQVWLVDVDTTVNVEATMLFVALPTSTFGELRERLRRRLHVSRAGYNEYRIGVISGAGVWLTPNSIKWLGGGVDVPTSSALLAQRKVDDDLDPTPAQAHAPAPAVDANASPAAPTVAAPTAPAVHPAASFDGELLKNVVGSGHLCVLRPRHVVANLKRRKYQPQQKAIKIYG